METENQKGFWNKEKKMNEKNYRRFIPLAIAGVVFGVTLFIFLFTQLSGKLGINDLPYRIKKMPPFVLYWIGIANVATFIPVFFLGIVKLKPRGAVGCSTEVVKDGVYRYVRNPMYAGLSFTLFGLGLLLMNFGVSLAGLFWLLICYFQVKREELELEKRFGREYLDYKSGIPRFVPDFGKMVFDWLKITPKKEKLKKKYNSKIN